MRNPKKYLVLSVMTMALALLLGVNCFREPSRLSETATWQHEQYVEAGAALYAQNCMMCHGPNGEGVVGMPLQRKDLQGDEDKKADVYKMLYNTIYNGRPGNAVHPQWVKVDDGSGKQHFLSYTAMPAWGQTMGGPMDEDKVRSLALFIMNGNWNMLRDTEEGKAKYPPGDPSYNGALPDAEVSPEINAAAKALLEKRGTSMCLSCHAIGSVGAHIGPDLTYLGSWGIDETFLKNWIRHPSGNGAMPHDERMPIYWSMNRAYGTPTPTLTATGDKPTATLSTGPYFMPPVPLSDQDLDTLVKYLMGLKATDDPTSIHYKK